ncbi:DEAD/DEAH box helicase [Patescibacteria group bacterium]|nr:DEAD/DEAH box helicase [Patescibacteria group bacterium]
MGRRSFGGRRRPLHFREKKKFSPKEKGFDVCKLVNNAAPAIKTKEYNTLNSFDDFALDSRLKRNVAAKGYKKPTPIQDQAIPHALRGNDIVGAANTGTGKTAAFLLPMLHKVLNDRSQRVLILAPTRELALQIEEEFNAFANDLGIRSVLCIGGTNMLAQIRKLKKHHNFIIGTPGRIKDLFQRRLLHLESFRNVILDEVDRMLDMGFIHDIKYLLAQLPEQRHSLFFSATISREIEELIRTFLQDPLKISVVERETAPNVQQDVIRIRPDQNRVDVIKDLLQKDEFRKVLVFGRTKRGVDRLYKALFQKGFKVDSIHGDKTQSRRQRALRDFRENKIRILVATDVAARGLDIDDVSHVINFDMPNTHDDYIHRIGRTGRGDKMGIALTFVDEK